MTINDPNGQNIQLLIDALRSGEFEQGQETLRKGDRYCCLGVGCEVFRQHNPGWEWGPSTLEGVWAFRRSGSSEEAGDISFLPTEVREWFGVRLADPLLTPKGFSHQLTAIDLNDGRNASFAEIADAFERTFIKKEEKNAEIPVSDRRDSGEQEDL